MRAYQIKVKGKDFGVPFIRYDDFVKMLANLIDFETSTTVQMVEVKAGEAYRDGNTIIVDGIIRGVYTSDHAECI